MSFNFAAALTAKASEVPKQVFADSLAQEPTPGADNSSASQSAEPIPPTPASDGNPASSDAPPVTEQQPLTPNEMQAQAELWVEMTDLILSRSLSAIGDKPVEENKATPQEKSTLKDALVRYFSTLQSPPQIPAWLFLLGVVILIYGPKTFVAVKEFRAKKKAEKKKKAEPEKPAGMTIVKSDIEKPIKFDTGAKDFGKIADTQQILNQNTSSDPYFILIGKVNPVSPNENILRKRTGGKLCKFCEINYTNKGRNTCSTICSGKYSAKKNGKKSKSKTSKTATAQ